MFGLEYLLNLVIVLFVLAKAILASCLMTPAWNCVAAAFLNGYVPERFMHIHFWQMVAIFIVVHYIGEGINKLCPKIVSVNSSTEEILKSRKFNNGGVLAENAKI